MPIYEFYCPDCHRLYNFFSSRVDTQVRPDCPRCARPELERRPARFATLRSGGDPSEGEDDSLPPGLDEARMEEAFASVASEMESLGDDEDPRAMARLMRRMTDTAGVEAAGPMREFLERLEAGEDPDALEDEFESAFDETSEFADLFRSSATGAVTRRRPPGRDETLYFL